MLLDLTMPILDGARALREIRAIAPTVRVLVMSGFGQQETLHKLRDAGEVGFITKPFAYQELTAAVAQLHTG